MLEKENEREGRGKMSACIAERMEQLMPSGIRKVNEKALAMERAGERVFHFELDVYKRQL